MRSCVSTEAVDYEVVHTSKYEYTEAVSVSHHVARLRPRVLAYQECVQHDLQIEPSPAVVAAHQDYFGNAATFFAMQGAHKNLSVSARSRVRVLPRDTPPPPSATPPWEAASDRAALPLEAFECLVDASPARVRAELDGYARPSFPSLRPLLDAVLELTRRIYEDFTFDPRATTVTTPLTEVLKLRRGVCQDFARLEIACLRTLGLAAHYVSGYVETIPPPGLPRRVGADASHAWLAIYCPGFGWIDVDPTNNLLVSTTHVTLAWGRDYGDVSPIRGVILGGGEHALKVSVNVARVRGAEGSGGQAPAPG